MCGIAGWYRRGRAGVRREIIQAQCNAIAHRGPDDEGYLTDRDLGMGMRRLSIIDVRGGHQPIRANDGRHSIVFNGEIYNHLELRPALEAKGYHFTTQSDTETLLAAFVVWGNDAWLQLEGMYAVAIWDSLERALVLARDPLGVKPLYLTEQSGGLAFASEIRALTSLPEHEFDIDDRAVHDFFRFGHIQRPRSIYRQVRQLDPGHVLRIGPRGAASVEQFWKPRVQVKEGVSDADWVEETRARVLETVRSHMLADVPIGALLSGGVDSSTITAAMARQTSQPITAFTVGFPGHRSDETDSAREIARHIGCEHVVLPVELGRAQDVVPEIQRAFDEPLGASAVIPCWYVSKLAAEHVKVVLCGEGGDELFAGYKRQHNALLMEQWKPVIQLLGPTASLVGRIPFTASRTWNLLRELVGPLRDSAHLASGFQRFFAGTQITPRGLQQRIFRADFRQREERSIAELEAEYFDEPDWKQGSMLEQFMLGDLTVHMPAALLPRLDRSSMAHSLEARVPFLSHRFVDWSLTVPIDMKVRGHGKYALREAARPWLPDGILERPKQGFQMPVADWFLGDFSEFALEAWRDSGIAAQGWLEPKVIEDLFAEHRSGRANHGKLLYAITIFSCWWNARSSPPTPLSH